METFYAKVLEQLDDYRFKVKRMNAVERSEASLAEVATVLSMMPTGRGAGFRAGASKCDNLYAVCFKDSAYMVFILGFVPGSFAREITRSEPGGFVLASADNTHVKAFGDGSLSLYTSEYSQLVLEPRAESLFGQFKNVTFKYWTGSNSIRPGIYRFYYAKDQDLTALHTHKTDTKPDNFIIDIGKSDEAKGTVNFWIKENYDSTGSSIYSLTGTIGDKNIIALSFAETDLKITSDITWTTDGALLYSVKNTDTKNNVQWKFDEKSLISTLTFNDAKAKVDLILDSSVDNQFSIIGSGEGASKKYSLAMGTGSSALILRLADDKVKLDIASDGGIILDNGKCVITVTASGDVTIKADGTIKIGGSGNEQRLVTESWVKDEYAKHQHQAQGPASPTSTPFPLDMSIYSPGSDSSSNQFTNTTRAE